MKLGLKFFPIFALLPRPIQVLLLRQSQPSHPIEKTVFGPLREIKKQEVIDKIRSVTCFTEEEKVELLLQLKDVSGFLVYKSFTREEKKKFLLEIKSASGIFTQDEFAEIFTTLSRYFKESVKERDKFFLNPGNSFSEIESFHKRNTHKVNEISNLIDAISPYEIIRQQT